MKFKIVRIDYNYCNYLRKYENKVSYNDGRKELRPFVGILFLIDEMEYFAPLSSHKRKHFKLNNNIDLVKIDKGNLGVINLNNMIPVCSNNYFVIDLNNPIDEFEKKYFLLLRNQLRFLNKEKDIILKKAFNLYNLYKEDKLAKRVKNRCCNFMLLEEKCLEYNKETVKL